MAKNIDLAKLFGVEGMVTTKTLVTESLREVSRKTPNEAGDDIKALLDEMTTRVVSGDIVGVLECLNAMQIRLDYMVKVANELKKASGK